MPVNPEVYESQFERRERKELKRKPVKMKKPVESKPVKRGKR